MRQEETGNSIVICELKWGEREMSVGSEVGGERIECKI